MTSADTDTDAMTALQDLLDERQRYEGWLAVLDERRNSTPAQVYERVHTDYSLRLERVTERLSERAGQLAGTIEAMLSRLNALRTRESERTDSRHEAELRAAVGEYGPEDWDRLRSSADLELGELANERGALEAEVAELERVVALTRRDAIGAEESNETSATSPDESWTEADSFEGQNNGDPGWDSRQQEAGNGDRDMGSAQAEPLINEFVAEWPVTQPDSAAEPEPQGDGVPEVPEIDGGGPIQVVDAPQPSAIRFGATSAAAPAPASSIPSMPSAPAPRPVPPTGDTRRENEKTLKCPECGVMNYATEWYCERCGGELSTF